MAVGDDQDQEDDEIQSVGDWPSLDVIFDAIQGRVDEQKARIGELDSKSGFTLGAASILTGGVATLTTGLADYTGKDAKPMEYLNLGNWDPSITEVSTIIIACILASYAWVVWASFQAYRLRPMVITPSPQRLAKHYVHLDPKLTKANMAESMAKAFETNKPQIRDKTKWTNLAILGIGLEAILALIVGIIQVWMV